MGTATYGGKGFKEGPRVSGERPKGAARFTQQCKQASCPPLQGVALIFILAIGGGAPHWDSPPPLLL